MALSSRSFSAEAVLHRLGILFYSSIASSDDATRSTPDLPTSKCEILLAKFDTSRWLVLVLLDLFAA